MAAPAPTLIDIATQGELDDLVGAQGAPDTIKVSNTEALVLTNAGAVVFSDTMKLEGFAWNSAHGTFAKSGAGTLTFDGATIEGGEVYITGGRANFVGNSVIDYLAVGTGAGGQGEMTIGDGASLTIHHTLQVGDWGGVGVVNQTGGTVALTPSCVSDPARCVGVSIGNQGGTGTYNISGGELLFESGGFTIGRNAGTNPASTGTLNISGSALVDISGGGSIVIGDRDKNTSGSESTGTINQSGGTLRINSDAALYIAGYGTGTYNLGGGALEIGGSSLHARYNNTTSSSNFNLGGGTIKVIGNALTTGADLNATLVAGTVSTFDTNGLGANWQGGLTGDGGLRKIGAGDLAIGTLSNTISSLGIAAGSVSVGRDFLLDNGGTETATTLDIAAGGVLKVSGGFSMGENDTYVIGINGAGASSLIDVTGAAEFYGTTFVVEASAGYRVDHNYHIIHADDGANGGGVTLREDFAFLEANLGSDDENDVYLTLTQDEAFASAAQTANHAAAANGLDSVSGPSDLFDAVQLLSSTNAPDAFDAMSGEIHAASAGVLLNNSFFLRDAVLGRLQYPSQGSAAPSVSLASGYAEGDKRSAAPFPGVEAAPAVEAGTFWTQAFGSWGHSDGDANVAKLDSSTGGALVGYDHSFGKDWLIGAAAGYSRSSFDLDDRASSGDSDNYHLLAYAGGKVSAVNVRLGASYTWNEIDTTRNVLLPGFSEQEKADYSAGTAQVFGELGYDVAVSAATKIEPFAGLAYVYLSTDGFGETGGSAALSADSSNQSVTYGTLGLRAEHKLLVGDVGVTLQGSAAWQHAWGDVTPTMAMAFAGGDAFQVTGAPIAQDAALIKAGFDVDVTAGAKLGLFYLGQLASDAADNSVQGRLSVAF